MLDRDIGLRIVMKDLSQFSVVYLVPLADLHEGAKEADHEVSEGYIKWIKERDNAFAILNGDLMNCAWKDSTPELYEDMITPDDAYQNLVLRLLPIKDKILMATRGGHEGSIYRKTGTDYMAHLVHDLRADPTDYSHKTDIPYRPDGGMVGMRLSKNNHRFIFFAYATHGWGGARTMGAKVKKADDLAQIADADCHHPYTKVLRGNMVWDELGNIDVGDELIGISEYPEFNKARQVVHTHVTDKWSKKSPTLRIILEDGTALITTAGHLWLARRRHRGNILGGRYDWFRTDVLSVGDKLLQVFPTWQTSDNWMSGYIAGLLDGEGSITVNSKYRSRQLAFTQKEGLVMSLMEDYLGDNEVSYRKNTGEDNVSNLLVRVDAPKLLGMTQPKRLCAKGRTLVEKRLHKPKVLKIEAIEPWKESEVIALETDAKTFLTEGIATHNCYILSHDHTQNVHRVNLLQAPITTIRWNRPNYLTVKRKLIVNTGGWLKYGGYVQRNGYTPQDLGTPRIRMEVKKSHDRYEKDLHCGI